MNTLKTAYFALIIGVITCISCGSSANSESTNSNDSTQTQETSSANGLSVSGENLFAELKGDLPTAASKYEGQRVTITNLLVVGGLIDRVTNERIIYCLPLSADNTKMAYIHKDYGSKVEHFKS